MKMRLPSIFSFCSIINIGNIPNLFDSRSIRELIFSNSGNVAGMHYIENEIVFHIL